MWSYSFLYKQFLIKQINSVLLSMESSENQLGAEKHMDTGQFALIAYNGETKFKENP